MLGLKLNHASKKGPRNTFLVLGKQRGRLRACPWNNLMNITKYFKWMYKENWCKLFETRQTKTCNVDSDCKLVVVPANHFTQNVRVFFNLVRTKFTHIFSSISLVLGVIMELPWNLWHNPMIKVTDADEFTKDDMSSETMLSYPMHMNSFKASS